MVVSELRGEKIDIIPWNTEPARFVAKALSPARVREVYIDDDTKDATVIVPDDQLALAIGKEGLNARLAARLTGWKVDIQSDSEFAQAEAEAAFAGDGENEEFTGRCSAVLSNGKRCPNAALPGTKYCGVPAHQELAKHEKDVPADVPADAPAAEPPVRESGRGEETQPGVSPADQAPAEAAPAEPLPEEESVAAAERAAAGEAPAEDANAG